MAQMRKVGEQMAGRWSDRRRAWKIRMQRPSATSPTNVPALFACAGISKKHDYTRSTCRQSQSSLEWIPLYLHSQPHRVGK